jgi:hypothetical protein
MLFGTRVTAFWRSSPHFPIRQKKTRISHASSHFFIAAHITVFSLVEPALCDMFVYDEPNKKTDKHRE